MHRKHTHALIETLLIIFGLWRMLNNFTLMYFYDGMSRYAAMQELLQGKISPMAYWGSAT